MLRRKLKRDKKYVSLKNCFHPLINEWKMVWINKVRENEFLEVKWRALYSEEKRANGKQRNFVTWDRKVKPAGDRLVLMICTQKQTRNPRGKEKRPTMMDGMTSRRENVGGAEKFRLKSFALVSQGTRHLWE